MTTYRGCIAYGTYLVAAIEDESGELFELTPCRAERLHPSCLGFGWGYVGSGPHCLALSLLLDATGDVGSSLELYHEFTLAYVRDWPARWEITSDDVQTWVGIQQARQEAIA